MKNLIGYEWKEASNGATIEVVNPATQELIDTVPNVTEEDVDAAVKVAMVEQKNWEKVSIYDRADILYKFVELVEENKELPTDAGAYLLVHCGGRRLGIGDRIDEVAKQLKKEAKGVPFIAVFTFGEYGVYDHGSNTTGGLMLSFTAFGK